MPSPAKKALPNYDTNNFYYNLASAFEETKEDELYDLKQQARIIASGMPYANRTVGAQLSFAVIAHILKLIKNILLTIGLAFAVLVTVFKDYEVGVERKLTIVLQNNSGSPAAEETETTDIIHASEVFKTCFYESFLTSIYNFANIFVSLGAFVNALSSVNGYMEQRIEELDNVKASEWTKQEQNERAVLSHAVDHQNRLAGSIWSIFSSDADKVIQDKIRSFTASQADSFVQDSDDEVGSQPSV